MHILVKNEKNIRAFVRDRLGLEGKTAEKKVASYLKRWDDAMAQPIPVCAVVTIEWKKNRTWGNNPHALAEVCYADHSCERFRSTCSGCGYDKQSMALASLFKQFMLGAVIAKTPRLRRLDELPYGLNVDPGGIHPPSFGGGVGLSCYVDNEYAVKYGGLRIFQAINWSFTVVTTAHERFDVFELVPKVWPRTPKGKVK